MTENNNLQATGDISPFERIRRTNDAGAEYWSSRDFAGVLGYTDYRNFEQVVGKARLACFNSGQSRPYLCCGVLSACLGWIIGM